MIIQMINGQNDDVTDDTDVYRKYFWSRLHGEEEKAYNVDFDA